MRALRALLWCAAAIVLATVGCSKPVPPAAPLESAKFHMERGQWDKAIADASQAINANPNEHRAFTLRGRAYQGKGELDNALADLSEAIRIAPKHAEAYYSRALVYRRLGKQREMIADELKGRQVDPTYVNASLREYELTERRRVTDAALKAFKDPKKGDEGASKTESEAEKPALVRPEPEPDRPRRDPLTGLVEEDAERHSEVNKDAFGLPIELDANRAADNLLGRSSDRRRRPLGDDATDSQGDQDALAEGDEADRGGSSDPSGTNTSRGRTFAEDGAAPESEFEDEGAQEARPPQLPPRGPRQLNPYTGKNQTPFSGGRTSLYGGASESPEPLLDTQEVAPRVGGRPAAAGPRARARGDAQASPQGARRGAPYSDRAQTPFNRSGSTPFSQPNRRSDVEPVQDDFD